MATPYCTVDEVKAQSQKQFDTYDGVLTAMILAASESIDNYCNRPDGFIAGDSATARIYAGSGMMWQRIDECVEVTQVEVKDSPTDDEYELWPSTDWIAFAGDPKWPNFNGPRYHAVKIDIASGTYEIFPKSEFPTVRITARWGYAETVPDVVKQACIVQVSRMSKRGQSGWADSIATGDMGSMNYRKLLDPDVQFMLKMGRLIRPSVG